MMPLSMLPIANPAKGSIPGLSSSASGEIRYDARTVNIVGPPPGSSALGDILAFVGGGPGGKSVSPNPEYVASVSTASGNGNYGVFLAAAILAVAMLVMAKKATEKKDDDKDSEKDE